MQVALVHPPVSVARDFIDYPYFDNLGAVQLAAVLRDLVDLQLVDAFSLPAAELRWVDDRAHLGAPADTTADALDGQFDVIIITYGPFHRPPHRDPLLADLLQRLQHRHPDTPLWLVDAYQSGQHYVEAGGDDVLASYPEASVWLKYEAEATLPRLLSQLDEGHIPTGTIRGEALPDLDTLPVPAWDLIDLEHFDAFRASVVQELGRGHWAFPIDGRTLPAVTSRGCPFTCVHCSSNPDRRPGEPKTQRRLSSNRLDELISRLTSKHGANRLALLDEMININTRHFEGVLDAIEAQDVAFDVPNGMRADYLEHQHLARMVGRVTTVSVSAESGSKRVVDEVVGKQLDLSAIERVAESTHRLGIPSMVHYMIGLPAETAAEVNETLAFALDLWDRFGSWPSLQFATPLPGTELARSLPRPSLPIVQDWGPRFQRVASGSDQLPAELLHRFRRTFEARLAASRGPQKLIMNVTYVCNNHCTFCAVGTRTQVDGHPTRQRQYLDKYRRLGVKMVDFDGGEPTLNPELIPLIRHARRIGYERINVTTNGRMCTYPEFAQRLVNSGLTTLLFSIHGADARTHAQQVGVAEAFEQSVSGIRHCVAARADHVELGMNITLTKGNVAQLPAVAQLAWDLDLRWLNIQFLTPFGRATRMVAPDTQAAADLTMQVIDTWRDRLKLQVINLPFCFMPGYESFLVGDLLKLQRHMVFVNNEHVNLAEYLAERRVRKPVCETCPHACFCGGFYELDRVPEPPWLIEPSDLVRDIR